MGLAWVELGIGLDGAYWVELNWIGLAWVVLGRRVWIGGGRIVLDSVGFGLDLIGLDWVG
jgi:hypothetical protein